MRTLVTIHRLNTHYCQWVTWMVSGLLHSMYHEEWDGGLKKGNVPLGTPTSHSVWGTPSPAPCAVSCRCASWQAEGGLTLSATIQVCIRTPEGIVFIPLILLYLETREHDWRDLFYTNCWHWCFKKCIYWIELSRVGVLCIFWHFTS